MIELRHLTKSYRTPAGRRTVFRDLNFTFPEKASIGIVGGNGAGKSTLMRLLGRMDTPDAGEVATDQRISWPVGLAGGFQGSLTGRDNVKFVCRINGATGEAMREKVAYVQRFAEIGDYFDLPVKTYSTGMRSRVAFGLSMAFDFDYYLIDESLSVGDEAFKRKSVEAFKERIATRKVILVSHSMSDVRRLCDVIVHLQAGQATLYTDLEAGIAAHLGAAYKPPVASKPVKADAQPAKLAGKPAEVAQKVPDPPADKAAERA